MGERCYDCSMTAVEAASELIQTLEMARAPLLAVTGQAADPRPDGKWSRKEILGHLIDSAANNHQRFVRMQHEEALVLPGYRQDDWVRTQNYAAREWRDLVELWMAYNRHLAHILRNADSSAATISGKGPPATSICSSLSRITCTICAIICSRSSRFRCSRPDVA